MAKLVKGIIAAMVTSMNDDESLNFEEIKKSLEDSVAIYQGMVYTDDTIKTAKTDVAELRALAKAIEEGDASIYEPIIIR